MRRTNLWCLGWVALIAGSAAPMASQITRPPITRPTVYTNSGRYRVVISGFACAKETVDSDKDGKKDEAYAAAAFVLWNRRDGRLISTPNVVRTVEYGDIGGRLGRIQAGSASRRGGIWSGNNGDYVPDGLNTQASVGSATPDKLPLLVFEGGLSDSTEALLVAPSVWESDGDPTGFNSYSNNWKAGGVGTLINSPAVQNQLTMVGLTPIVAPGDPTLAQIGNFFGGPIGAYLLNAVYWTTTAVDRPVGLIEYQGVGKYQDRLVVITREKLASLAVGGGMTIAIPFAEPMNDKLNGLYTAYLRVERIQ